MVNKKRRLGRGLDALLGTPSSAQKSPQGEVTPAKQEGSVATQPASTGPADNRHMREIPIEWIRPGKYQPRKEFDQEKLEELASSIKSQGIMQPIVLRQLEEEAYELIAGERRWRACQLAGLASIPALIRDVDDESAIALSLIENIQREDLNPMEEAMALSRLLEEFDLTHQQVAEAVGKSRSNVSNLLRLMNLAPSVARMLVSGDLEMGHARALLSLDDARQEQAALDISDRQLSVRQAEALVRGMLKAETAMPKETAGVDADTRRLELRLSEKLGQKVHIAHSAKGRGKVTINYASLDELDNILHHFGELE